MTDTLGKACLTLNPDLPEHLIQALYDDYALRFRTGVERSLFEVNRLDHLPGRQSVRRWVIGESTLIQRTYRRGGFLRKLVDRDYLYLGEKRTRALKEFQLLTRLYKKGLPVPKPIACLVRSHRFFFYQAELLTEEIQNALPLSLYLNLKDQQDQQDQQGEPRVWQNIGQMLRQFHHHSVYHADLNAHNILVDPTQHRCFLVDFDKSHDAHALNTHQCLRNLDRLHRSLLKLKSHGAVVLDLASCWSRLLEGYLEGYLEG